MDRDLVVMGCIQTPQAWIDGNSIWVSIIGVLSKKKREEEMAFSMAFVSL